MLVSSERFRKIGDNKDSLDMKTSSIIKVKQLVESTAEDFGCGQSSITYVLGKLFVFGGCDRSGLRVSSDIRYFDLSKFFSEKIHSQLH